MSLLAWIGRGRFSFSLTVLAILFFAVALAERFFIFRKFGRNFSVKNKAKVRDIQVNETDAFLEKKNVNTMTKFTLLLEKVKEHIFMRIEHSSLKHTNRITLTLWTVSAWLGSFLLAWLTVTPLLAFMILAVVVGISLILISNQRKMKAETENVELAEILDDVHLKRVFEAEDATRA